jgi:HD-like signal output (HDOD) protein
MTKLNLSSSSTFLYLSPITQKIFNRVEPSQSSVEDLQRLLCEDSVLADNLFKMINSASYAFNRKLESVGEAIEFVGVHGFRELVLLSSARKLFQNPELWYRAVFTAYCSKAISQRLGLKANLCSEIYSIALLLELGALFLDLKDPDYSYFIYGEESRMVRFIKEQERYGIDSHSITMSFLESFKLPANIKKIIISQKPDFNYSNFKLPNAIIDLAYRLSFMQEADEGDIQELVKLDQFQKFDFGFLDLDFEFVSKLHQEVRELSSL